jgi:hypothetical protein
MTTSSALTGQDIGQAARATNAILETLLADTSTPFTTWVALNVLATSGSTQPRDALVQRLIHGLKIAEDAARAAVADLVSKGYASEPAALELTADGRALHGRIRVGIDRITERLYADLPESDLATTRRILGIVTDRANAELP